MEHTYHKTLGSVSSYLISELKKQDNGIFSIKQAQGILKKGANATTDLLARLVKRGIISRLKPGLFLIIPMEADSNYLENRYVIARELARADQYYISHYSAMTIHGMTSHPVIDVFVTSPKRQKNRVISGVKFVFLSAKQSNFFGIEDAWVTKHEKAKVSDLEKTIIDGLARPELCGGVSEIAKGMWFVRNTIDYGKLITYYRKAGVDAVGKRLGLILETLNLSGGDILLKLEQSLKNSKAYVLFDPTLQSEGKYLNKWHIIVNFNPEELKAIVWA